MKTNRLSLTFTSLPENVLIARMLASSVGAQLDLPMNDLEELKVAISEAVSNAIIHGYANNPNHTVTVDIDIVGDIITVRVSDTGCGIEDIPQAMQASFSTDPERMGLGFVFMKSFMDSLDVASEPGRGTTVLMTKTYHSSPQTSH
ncbi:MAG: anti-sigma F factor [Gracilibacteraceae bacterium]|jgi:stage II sporulation protein AB (anti-sigma F factor)|nr:anti-sigma F factor [Gracilibacteraceae bacterium]